MYSPLLSSCFHAYTHTHINIIHIYPFQSTAYLFIRSGNDLYAPYIARSLLEKNPKFVGLFCKRDLTI